MKRAVLLLLLAGVATGCRVMGPGYKRPALAAPAEHRGALEPTSAASLADLPWWEIYRDPVLQGLVREALAANLDLHMACARVDQARALLGVAHADGQPQVDGSLSASRDYASDAFTNIGGRDRLDSTYRAAIGATWELDLWGRIRRGTEAAWEDLLATEEGRRGVVVTLVGDVAATYLELLSLDWQRDITLKTIETRTLTRDLFQKRLEGGLGSELEVARSTGDLAGAAAALPLVEAGIVQRENALALLLGRNPGPLDRGVPLADFLLPPQVPSGIPSQLLERRPDVLAAEHSLHAAVARVGVAKAARLPTISLTGALGLESAELKNILTARGATWSLGAGLLAPLLDGGRLRSQEAQAYALAQEAESAWIKAALTAFRDVSDSLALVKHSRETTDQQRIQVAARERALELAFKRFEGGLSSYFEILDAQRDLFPAQLLLAAAKRDELLATVGLYRALGGGWLPGAGDPACPPPNPCAPKVGCPCGPIPSGARTPVEPPPAPPAPSTGSGPSSPLAPATDAGSSAPTAPPTSPGCFPPPSDVPAAPER